MARYIDADKLIAALCDCTEDTWGKGLGAAWWAQSVKLKDNMVKCINNQPTADVAEVKWIPVAERLPKGRRKYLCICVFGESKMQVYDVLTFHPEQNAENGYVTGPHFSNEGMNDMRVTHWMPLPKMPSGAKMDGKEDA